MSLWDMRRQPRSLKLTQPSGSRYPPGVGIPGRRGSQVVRQGSAKPLFGGSIPPRASRTQPLIKRFGPSWASLVLIIPDK